MLKEFSKLSPEEVKKFKDFVYSPYFNKSNSIIKLFSYLNSKYPQITDKDLSVKAIGSYLSTEGKVNDVYTRKIISNFNSIFESFLVEEEIKNNEVGNKLTLLKAFQSKGFVKNFLKVYKSVNKKNKFIWKSDQFYLNEVNLLERFMEFNGAILYQKYFSTFQELGDNIDLLFISYKLNVFDSMKATERIYNRNIYKTTFKNEIFRFLENEESKISESHPFIYLLYLNLKMLESFDEADENKFINYFKSIKINDNNREYIRIFLTKLQYLYSTGYALKNNSAYNDKLFELYKWAFKMGYFKYFFIYGYIYRDTYLSIVNLSLFKQEYEWLNTFIKETKNMLEPSQSNEMYYLAKASLSHALKKYDDCFLYLNKINVSNSYFYFDVKILLIKIFIERREYESAERIATGASKFLKNNKKIIYGYVKSIKEKLLIVKKLLKFIDDNKHKNKILVLDFKEEILNINNVPQGFKLWSLKVLEDISNSMESHKSENSAVGRNLTIR